MAARSLSCSEHPDAELVPQRGYAWHPQGRLARRCPSGRRHELGSDHRCAWCGGPILSPRSYLAAYCGVACRVAAHRASKRADQARELAGSAGPDSGIDTAGMSPAGDAHTGRSS